MYLWPVANETGAWGRWGARAELGPQGSVSEANSAWGNWGTLGVAQALGGGREMSRTCCLKL